MWHALAHFAGTDNGSGGWYLWWSGFGSDLGEAAIIGGLIQMYRKHTCHVHRCWRIAHRATAAGDVVCRRHHPLPPPTHAQVIAAHQAASTP